MKTMVLGFFLCCLVTLYAQDIKPTDLKVTRVTAVRGESATALSGPVKCSPDGHVFLRQAEEHSFGTAVLRISADGSNRTRFGLQNVPSFADGLLVDFFVQHGKVYLLAEKSRPAGRLYVISVDSKGSASTPIEVQSDVKARQIGVFQSGEFLILGRQNDSEGHSRPFIGIFGPDGSLRKKIKLEKDPSALSGENPDNTSGSAQRGLPANTIIALTKVEAAPQGNLFIMRYSPNGPVYSVNAAGEVLSRFSLNAVSDSVTPLSIKAYDERIVVEMIRKDDPNQSRVSEVILYELDRTSGQPVAQYRHSDPRIGTALACADTTSYVFITGSAEGEFQLVQTAK